MKAKQRNQKERNNNESTDSVQKNTNSATSHRTGARRARFTRVARADAVTDWNLIASNAIVVTAGQPPPVSVLHFAMVQGAVYDAVNAIDRGHRPYLVQPPSNPTDSKEAATATAAFRVLVG